MQQKRPWSRNRHFFTAIDRPIYSCSTGSAAVYSRTSSYVGSQRSHAAPHLRHRPWPPRHARTGVHPAPCCRRGSRLIDRMSEPTTDVGDNPVVDLQALPGAGAAADTSGEQRVANPLWAEESEAENDEWRRNVAHDWEFIWDMLDEDATETLSRKEVDRAFELANHLDEHGTSARCIDQETQERLWQQMVADTARLGKLLQDDEISKEAFQQSMRDNEQVYGKLQNHLHEQRRQMHTATAFVGIGSAVTMMMLCYTGVATNALAPFICYKSCGKTWFDASVDSMPMLCGEGKHQRLMWASAAITLVFVCGLPIYLFIKVFLNIDHMVFTPPGLHSNTQLHFKLQWGWIYTRCAHAKSIESCHVDFRMDAVRYH
jgi:hypothetical protein